MRNKLYVIGGYKLDAELNIVGCPSEDYSLKVHEQYKKILRTYLIETTNFKNYEQKFKVISYFKPNLFQRFLAYIILPKDWYNNYKKYGCEY